MNIPEIKKNDEMFFKFPRTHHLFNTGGTAITRDDLLVDIKEVPLFYGPNSSTLIVQEKVDGANIGLSMTPDYKILAQNRSHYVTSLYSPQFSGLDEWIEKNSKGLCNILLFNNCRPGSLIIFGEWLKAKHSIFYDKLPDYFLFYDLWDSRIHKFYETDIINRLADKANLYTVPIIARKKFPDKKSLQLILESKSSFQKNGLVEGIYLRIEEGKYLSKRSKLVRPDFMQITEHWSRKKLVKNIISSNI